MILAANMISDASPMNLGAYDDTRISDLANIILKLTGLTTRIILDPTKPTGVMVRKSDMTKATEMLGWKPTTSLEEGIKKTIQWYLENKVAQITEW
jgi:nucleoside-diphosphate-sugar epimerase